MLSIFGRISLLFVHFIFVSFHYAHIFRVCVFFFLFMNFLCIFQKWMCVFSLSLSFVSFRFFCGDWYKIHEFAEQYNWNVCFFYQIKLWCRARYAFTLKMSQMNHTLTHSFIFLDKIHLKLLSNCNITRKKIQENEIAILKCSSCLKCSRKLKRIPKFIICNFVLIDARNHFPTSKLFNAKYLLWIIAQIIAIFYSNNLNVWIL